MHAAYKLVPTPIVQGPKGSFVNFKLKAYPGASGMINML